MITTLFVLLTGSALAQEKSEQVSPERARANFGRPVVLAADDVRAFPDAPAGFDKSPTNGLAGRTEVFEYDSTVTGTRRKAVVYLKQQTIPHVWNVDDHVHDRETWASNLYYFAQRMFR